MDTWSTWRLIVVPAAALVILGGAVGGAVGAMVALGVAVLLGLAAILYSERAALAMSGAAPASESDQPLVYSLTRTLCRRADMPMPAIYLIPADHPVAFAFGRNAKSASIAVSLGLLGMLERDELESVIAHQLAHIKNGSILAGSMAAVMAGTLARVPAFRLLAAGLARFAFPPDREFAADKTASRMIATPRSLARALRKLDRARSPDHSLSMGLFHHHPPLDERVKRLQTL